MKFNSYLPLLRIVLHGRSAAKILLATVASFTFSIAVILCTFGLMDGFDYLLKSGLRHSSGDILITSRKGFFPLTPHLSEQIAVVNPLGVAPVIQTEAFALKEGISKGVLVRGIESASFSSATGLNVNPGEDGVILGSELSKSLGASVGDDIALTFAKGNQTNDFLPTVRQFKVSGVIKHGIYQKDLRFIYISRHNLSEIMDVRDWINLIIISTHDPLKPLSSLESIEKERQQLKKILQMDFMVKPFWSEYSFLIEAVQVEKLSISIILQLIVVIAVFNIMAFVIYIMEKKSRDFFFLRAVGVALKDLMIFWFISILVLWAVACVGAYFLSIVFNWALQNLPFLQIPGEIYVLSSLQIRLDMNAYLTVYLLSLLWVFVAGIFGYWRLKHRPIVQGLRQEFNS
jgi:ABC-type lipoprotein release transport system permease subunit